MRKPIRIYFLCIHNRCRSQIAEAFARHYGGENVSVESAGLEPKELHPLTVEVMKEVGIDLSDHKSKKINMKTFVDSNIIVKLCEQVKEKCPVVPFGIRNVEWNITDPNPADESEPSLEEFRKTRDEIEVKVKQLLKELNAI